MSGVDVTTLELRVISDSVSRANERLDDLERKGAGAEVSASSLGTAFFRLLGPVASFATVLAGLNKQLEMTREFDKLNAGLITATGSAENASTAFAALTQFASTTPYDLQQVTSSFTKLVNYGLTPSEAALRSYGNTASAMSKDMSQMIEAVADATTGEFERLKEFGIRASKDGDVVRFTFRGVTEEVAMNSAAIEGYLIKLGENNFASAMADRMATADGALSNLADTWDNLFITISRQGVGDVIADTARFATEELQKLTDLIASGELVQYMAAIGNKFDGMGEDIQRTFQILQQALQPYQGEIGALGYSTEATVEFIKTSFAQLPENIRAMVQLITVELATWVNVGSTYAGAYSEAVGVEISNLLLKAEAWGSELMDKLNPFDGDTFNLDAALRGLRDTEAEVITEIFDLADRRVENYRSARMSSIDAVLQERDTAISSFDAQIEKARELGRVHAENAALAAQQTGDRLEQFKVGGEGDGQGDGGTSPVKGKKKGRATKGPRAKKGKADPTGDQIDSSMDALFTEEEQMVQSYTRRQKLLNDYYGKKLIDETKFETLTIRNKNKFIKEYEGMEKQQRQAAIAEYAAFASATVAIASAAFAGNKGVQRASAWVSTLVGAAKALELPYPANIAAMGHVIAQGIGLTQGISGTDAGGGGAGGYIGAGGVGSSITPVINVGASNNQLSPDAFLGKDVAEQSKVELTINLHNTRISNAQLLAEELREAIDRNLTPYLTVRGSV